MRHTWIVLAGLLLLPCAALAGDEDAGEKDPRVAWLSKHAVEIASIDPANADFSDLQPLKKIIGDRRLVQLGEESHGDGACFLAKARLIAFLHQEMGFDVLAFESGLYDCHRGWQEIRESTSGVPRGRTGIFGIWTASAEVQRLLEYVAEAAKSKRPLELCGFDCQLTSGLSREHLIEDLTAALKTHGLDAPKSRQWIAGIRTMGQHERPFTAEGVKSATRDFLGIAASFEEAGRKDPAVARACGYWAQLCRSLVQQAASQFQRSEGKVKGAAANNIRDAQMAANLIYLADEYFEGRKVIVWAATSHLMRNPERVKDTEGNHSLDGYVPMGHAVWKHFGDDAYTLGFTAYEGRKGYPHMGRIFPFDDAPADSFDDLCRRAGLENAIVDLRNPPEGGGWLHEAFVTRPLGYADMRGTWHQVVDGLFFQRVMTPSSRAGNRPSKDVPDLGPLIEARWKQIRRGLDGGNMWADKWTFDGELDQWLQAYEPDAKTIESREKQVEKFLQAHKRDEEATWRGLALLAAMAVARGDTKAAGIHFEAALGSFPAKELRQPARTSQFHHLVTKRAFLIWDGKGAAAAQEYALEFLVHDARMHTLYLPDWDARLGGEAGAFRRALRKAYKARKKNFPKLADEIDRFVAQLD